MAKEKHSKEFQEAERELDSLLNRFEKNFTHEKDEDGKESKKKAKATQPEELVDLDELDDKLGRDAKGLVDSLYNLYFTAGIIKKDVLLAKRKEIDEMNLSNMLFQVNTIKLSIKAAQRIINRGDPHPRLLEAVSDLHVKFSDVTKNLANYVLFLEETVKAKRNDMLNEVPMALAEGDTTKFAAIAEKSEIQESKSIAVIKKDRTKKLITNPKDLVDDIQEKNKDMEKSKLYSKPLTDPFNKEKLAGTLGIDLKEINEEEDYEELNDIV